MIAHAPPIPAFPETVAPMQVVKCRFCATVIRDLYEVQIYSTLNRKRSRLCVMLIASLRPGKRVEGGVIAPYFCASAASRNDKLRCVANAKMKRRTTAQTRAFRPARGNARGVGGAATHKQEGEPEGATKSDVSNNKPARGGRFPERESPSASKTGCSHFPRARCAEWLRRSRAQSG